MIAVLAGIGPGALVADTFFRSHLIATETVMISAILIMAWVGAMATGLVLKFIRAQMRQ